MPEIKGKIHSFESFGTLDGPGIRFVVFCEGCPLRCLYCHNVDMLDMKDYKEYTAKELVEIVRKYKPFFRGSAGGGVTVSGGDPIMQPDFIYEFFKECKKEGIHTTIDTSLYTVKKILDKLIPVTDLFMVSLKHFNDKIHKWLTSVSNKMILENVRYLSEKGVRLRLRFLILPGYTDTEENLNALSKFLKSLSQFELLELLPYHTYGVYKWKKLKKPYLLSHVKVPSLSYCQNIKKKLEKQGFRILLNE